MFNVQRQVNKWCVCFSSPLFILFDSGNKTSRVKEDEFKCDVSGVRSEERLRVRRREGEEE